MSYQVESSLTETQKIVALRIRADVPRRSKSDLLKACSRFPDVEQLADDIFRKDKLRCA